MAAPNDFDTTHVIDDYLSQEEEIEPSYTDIVGWMSGRVQNAVIRYERRLGRELTIHEGQVLMHALTLPDPQKKPGRFKRCADCGDWIDLGLLIARHSIQYGPILCDYCEVPF